MVANRMYDDIPPRRDDIPPRSGAWRVRGLDRPQLVVIVMCERRACQCERGAWRLQKEIL